MFLAQLEPVAEGSFQLEVWVVDPMVYHPAQTRYEHHCIYSTAYFSDTNTPLSGTVQSVRGIQSAAGFCGFLFDCVFPRRGISDIWM